MKWNDIWGDLLQMIDDDLLLLRHLLVKNLIFHKNTLFVYMQFTICEGEVCYNCVAIVIARDSIGKLNEWHTNMFDTSKAQQTNANNNCTAYLRYSGGSGNTTSCALDYFILTDEYILKGKLT